MADRVRSLQDRAALICANLADRVRPLQDRAALGCVNLANRARSLQDRALPWAVVSAWPIVLTRCSITLP